MSACRQQTITWSAARIIVGDLTPEQLDRIAGEDVFTKRSRTELTRQVDSLQKERKLFAMV